MKIVFMSDIHGVPSTLKAALSAADTLGYDRLVLLGDLLYHGPRNGVPNFYDPEDVAKTLNTPLDFIPRGEAMLFADGEPWAFSRPAVLPQTVTCKPRGGFVLVVRQPSGFSTTAKRR